MKSIFSSLCYLWTAFWELIFGKKQDHISSVLHRKLGDTEKYYHYACEKACTIVSSVFFVSSKQQITEDHVRQCMKRLMDIHPMLRMCIVDYGGEPHWKDMGNPQPDLRVDYSTDWHKVFKEDVKEVYDASHGPLWRVTLMPDVIEYADLDYDYHAAIVLGINHAIADGTGYMKLMTEFKELLATCVGQGDLKSTSHSQREHLKVPPSTHECTNGKKSLLDKILLHILRLKFVQKIAINLVVRSKRDVFAETVGPASKSKPGTQSLETCIYPFVLSKDDTNLILKACKIQKLSVQGAIQAASSKAASEIVLEAAERKGIPTDSLPPGDMSTSASLLKHLAYYGAECLDNQVGNFTFNIKDKVNIVECAEGHFWGLVKRNHEYLRGHVYTGLKAANLNDILASYLFKERFDVVPNYARSLLQFTNYGNVNYLNNKYNDQLKFTGSFSGISIHHIGPTFANFITSVNDKMFWGVLYVPTVTDVALVKRYSDRCAEILVDNCKEMIAKHV